jgi:hypothetical protein
MKITVFLIELCWIWRYQVPFKCQCSSTKLHVITSQNVAIFMCKVALTNEPQRVDACFVNLKMEKEPASLTIQRSDKNWFYQWAPHNSYQPIWVADFGWSVNHVKSSISSVQNLCCLIYRFRSEGYSPANHHPPSPWVRPEYCAFIPLKFNYFSA